jgi:hypothetical protein
MIVCPTCAAENDEFSIVCSNCRGYLQNRIPNLDFFPTVWGIIESPRKTFRHIRLAEHKNYVLPLSAFFGIALSFTVFWYLKMGGKFFSLVELVTAGILTGTTAGSLLFTLLVVIYHLLARVMGGKSAFRDSFALLAYACVPIALSLVVVLPFELMTFGIYLFTSNPHPYVVQPVSYVILIGADVGVSVWSLLLAITGTIIVHGLSVPRAALAVLLALAVPAGAFFLFVRDLEHTVFLPGWF